MWLFGLLEVALNKTCNNLRTIKCLSDVHQIRFGLKQEDVSALLRFKFALIYAIREIEANLKGIEIEWNPWESVYINDANLLGENKYSFCLGNKRGAFFGR
jgi:hypothetical protein